MIYYMIRHKASGEFMPQLKRRGYTHWNPSAGKTEDIFTKDTLTGTPRLLSSRNKASKVIVQWIALPNASYGSSVGYDGEEDWDIKTEDDGRKKEDLEIVEVNIEEVKNNGL